MIKKLLISGLAAFTLAGCSAPSNMPVVGSEEIHIRLDKTFSVTECEWLGDITGSEGHWYSYLFYTNDVMIQGAVNQLKNKAHDLGADTIVMIHPQDFVTSFTVFGNAYRCE
ncbi:DUF4156 domain-containing protein [Vibrio mexicanus]|uniref:DUF4156 domain-containing protein n=1 Tax=Vibrio mexicanus TaxID=1004326 RepID=UPI00063C9F01|nr:DUF4156 domain-containing protein [Vibrio mexicanus]